MLLSANLEARNETTESVVGKNSKKGAGWSSVGGCKS